MTKHRDLVHTSRPLQSCKMAGGIKPCLAVSLSMTSIPVRQVEMSSSASSSHSDTTASSSLGALTRMGVVFAAGTAGLGCEGGGGGGTLFVAIGAETAAHTTRDQR